MKTKRQKCGVRNAEWGARSTECGMAASRLNVGRSMFKIAAVCLVLTLHARAVTFTQTVNMNGNAITNAAAPDGSSPASQVATKGYADSICGTADSNVLFIGASAPPGGDASGLSRSR